MDIDRCILSLGPPVLVILCEMDIEFMIISVEF
jgi:hypothetical protein